MRARTTITPDVYVNGPFFRKLSFGQTHLSDSSTLPVAWCRILSPLISPLDEARRREPGGNSGEADADPTDSVGARSGIHRKRGLGSGNEFVARNGVFW